MPLDYASSNSSRFSIEELFFSRTDKRGVIQTGNGVFQRVSGYEWSQLINAPHKLVRHPDMPKGVFELMWKTIQNGDPIGAYICNQTEDGEPYWVFATVFPLEDGYLSVRLKPTSGLLEKVVPVYNALAEKERNEKVRPDASAEQLVAEIRNLGFFGYQDFMAHALIQELKARTTAMGHHGDATIEALSETLQSTNELEDAATRVQAVFRDTHQIPYNMRLQAGRIEGSDGPISVISGNHRQMSQGLETIVEQFRSASKVSVDAICVAALEIALSQILQESQTMLREDDDPELPNREETVDLLGSHAGIFRRRSFDKLQGAADGVRRFQKQSRHMRRALSGLELTRIMCKIERFKIGGEHSGLDEIVTRLAYAQKALEESCNEIERVIDQILEHADDLLRDNAKAAA